MHNNSLYNNYQKLKRCLNRNDDTALIDILQKTIPLLEKKYAKTENSKIISHIFSFKSHLTSPTSENIKAILQNPEVSHLFKRTVDAVLINSENAARIYTKQQAVCASTTINNKIILRNILNEDQVQSWSKPESVSLEYNRHLRKSPPSEKSKFTLSNEQIEKLEHYLFINGIGIISHKNRIFFYGAFSSTIGKVEGKLTKFVRMQCDRNPSRKGYIIQVHAYPISLSEIACDFSEFVDKNLVGENIHELHNII